MQAERNKEKEDKKEYNNGELGKNVRRGREQEERKVREEERKKRKG